ncbi:MAG: CvpA family protein [Gammaproteobacteria bacterium]|nr:CvpA family protein [Gammaproteobacteria bacterium]MBU1603455.1 CvpA family protein [Gammaproteobacteria bacterium]MBU2432975.1 CvpA family protein [Gammaproteobacteria bacterium]MBU2450218.1 CvpA family protein [Gammaproteobacteria bacterium]
MTGFDYVVIGIVSVSLLFGLWRGVVGEVIALVAWGVGIFAAIEFGTTVGNSVFAGLSDPALRTLAGCVVIFVGILVTMAVLNMVVRSMVKALGLSVSDRLLGMLFGLARGVVVVMVLVGLGGMTSAPIQPWWRNAMLSAPLETVVLAAMPWLPDDLAKRIRFS